MAAMQGAGPLTGWALLGQQCGAATCTGLIAACITLVVLRIPMFPGRAKAVTASEEERN